MTASNAFLNGFLGGMGAMNTMIDSKARREHVQWQKGLIEEDRALAEQERNREQNLRSLNASYHAYQNLNSTGKKAVGDALIKSINHVPGMAQVMDNNNPTEYSELGDIRFVKNDAGESFVVPVVNVYDTKTKKLLRTGDYSQNRENGGPSMGMSMQAFNEFMSSQAGSGPARALEAEILRQGGTLPEAKTVYGEKYLYNGHILQDESTGKTRSLGKVDVDGSGSGSGSGSGLGAEEGWKSRGTRIIPNPDYPDDPSKELEVYDFHRVLPNGETEIREIVNYGNGRTEVDQYFAKTTKNTEMQGDTSLDTVIPDPDADSKQAKDINSKDESKPQKEEKTQKETKPKPKNVNPSGTSQPYGVNNYYQLTKQQKDLAKQRNAEAFSRFNERRKRNSAYMENFRMGVDF